MFKVFKIGILSLFCFVFSFAKPFVIENENQLVEKTVGFIEILSSEVYEKTGVKMYIVALEDLGKMNLQEKESSYTYNLQNPYVLLFFSKNEKKINIIVSQEVERMFDKNEVYWDYIVPLIPNSAKELTNERISAFLLNGFVDMADRIAEFHNVKLEHNFPTQNKGVQIAVRTALYGMLFVLFVLFVFVYLRRK